MELLIETGLLVNITSVGLERHTTGTFRLPAAAACLDGAVLPQPLLRLDLLLRLGVGQLLCQDFSSSSERRSLLEDFLTR